MRARALHLLVKQCRRMHGVGATLVAIGAGPIVLISLLAGTSSLGLNGGALAGGMCVVLCPTFSRHNGPCFSLRTLVRTDSFYV